MKKIHAFGCSLTAQHNWKYMNDCVDGPFKSEGDAGHDVYSILQEKTPHEWNYNGIDMSSYAICNGSHNMQLIQYANGVHHKTIKQKDIIIWQITDWTRHGVRCENRYGREENLTNYDENGRVMGILRDKNIYTNTDITMATNKEMPKDKNPSILPISKNLKQQVAYSRSNDEAMYEQTWAINGIKRNNNKLIVLFGWDLCFPGESKNVIVKFLKENNIDYIRESIFDWTIKTGYSQSITNHPDRKGYRGFTRKKLMPKLQELGW